MSKLVSKHNFASANDSLNLQNSPIAFSFEESLTETEVQISFSDYYDEVKLVYYPGYLDTSILSRETAANSVKCVIVNVAKVVIGDLQPSTVYTFCALFPNEAIESPFQCKSAQTKLSLDQQPWIAQDKKVMALIVFLAVTVIVFVIGIILTYFLIRRVPRLIRSSKRVVRVHSQPEQESPATSRTCSIQKETNTFENMDAPIYLSPQPPHNSDFG